MQQIWKLLKLAAVACTALVLLAWAGALIYGIYLEPEHWLRYGTKLVMIAGIFFWYLDRNNSAQSDTE